MFFLLENLNKTDINSFIIFEKIEDFGSTIKDIIGFLYKILTSQDKFGFNFLIKEQVNGDYCMLRYVIYFLNNLLYSKILKIYLISKKLHF